MDIQPWNPTGTLMKRFQIKICGITNPVDAEKAVELGADAIGLNFYANSKRCVELETAREIAQKVADSAIKVGVFVNHSIDDVLSIKSFVGLDVIQLHGDEHPDVLKETKGHAVIRAIRLPPGESESGGAIPEAMIDSWRKQIEPWRNAAGILLDASAVGVYGGTGRQLDWKQVPRLNVSSHLILAGGLTPDNVALAVAEAQPNAVDVASGVERIPGNKDYDLMSRFILSGKQALLRHP